MQLLYNELLNKKITTLVSALSRTRVSKKSQRRAAKSCDRYLILHDKLHSYTHTYTYTYKKHLKQKKKMKSTCEYEFCGASLLRGDLGEGLRKIKSDQLQRSSSTYWCGHCERSVTMCNDESGENSRRTKPI